MNKIRFALCSLLLLSSCGASSSSDEGKSYLSSFKSACDSSYRCGSYFFSCPNGLKFAFGLRNQNDVYYHLSGSGLTFESGLKGAKGESASSLKAQLLLTGGDVKLETNSAKIPSSLQDFTKISGVKAKSYFDGDAVYFNASGENKGKETNATIGLLAQTAIREISGDSSYDLYGGGDVFQTKNRYKGKWTLEEEQKRKLSDEMPFVKEGESLSELFSFPSFLLGAYEDEMGKEAFSFTTYDDGRMRICFATKDEAVLSSALAAGFSSFSGETKTGESLPSQDEIKGKIERFFTYADIKTFGVTVYFDAAKLEQVSYDVNFDLDQAKIEEIYPEGMFDLSGGEDESEDKKDRIFNLDGSLSFLGTILAEFGAEDSFSLPDLSDYLEFPGIAKKEGGAE